QSRKEDCISLIFTRILGPETHALIVSEDGVISFICPLESGGSSPGRLINTAQARNGVLLGVVPEIHDHEHLPLVHPERLPVGHVSFSGEVEGSRNNVCGGGG